MTIIPEHLTATTWWLTGQVDDGEPPRDILIHPLPFRVGRRGDLSFRIPSPTVSHVHAEIVERDGNLLLRDLGSTNGTFVNGQRVSATMQLKAGDWLQFANVLFRLKRSGALDITETLQGENCDRAMALIQFDRLMAERGVIPFFQPIVRASDQRTVGYEVLGRSHLFGLKTPLVMFEAASQLNLESELSRLCRRVGLEAGRRLGSSTSFFLNTHPSEMEDLSVLQLSLQELRERYPRLPVTLEVHEATVTNSRIMQELRATLDDLEYRLAYDDFGAGQSRLVELMDVPPDILKFDLTLTRDIDQASERRQRTTANLVGISKELGIQPLAEGMETANEARVCLELGFELCQGFFYGEPVPVEDLLASTSLKESGNVEG